MPPAYITTLWETSKDNTFSIYNSPTPITDQIIGRIKAFSRIGGSPANQTFLILLVKNPATRVTKEPTTTSQTPNGEERLASAHPIHNPTLASGNNIGNKHIASANLN